MESKEKIRKRTSRHRRVRMKLSGTSERPRLSVFRSSKRMTLQLVDDENNKILLGMSDFGAAAKGKVKKTKIDIARDLGKKVAEAAKKKKISRIVFDKGGYAYHGRVKAVAEGVREGGLIF